MCRALLLTMGRVLPLVAGDQAGGIDLLTEALENYTGHGDRRNAARVLVHLGTVHISRLHIKGCR